MNSGWDVNFPLYYTVNPCLAVGNPDISVVKITKRQFIITENMQIWLTGVDGLGRVLD